MVKSKKDSNLHCKNKDCKIIMTESEYNTIVKVAQKKASLQKELSDLIDRHSMLTFKDPTKEFSIGEIVSINSGWNNCKIIDKHSNLFYLIEYSFTENNYGKPVTSTRTNWVMWQNIFKKQDGEKPTPIFNKRETSIFKRVSFSNRHVDSLIQTYYHFGIDLNPVYQRDLCWELEDKVKLIDSIFNMRDIGKFVFIHLPFVSNTNPGYEILDGKQRLATIIEFVEDRFQYNGYFYSQLQSVDKRMFADVLISWAEVQDLTEQDKYHYFVELNTTGKPQDQAHIEKVRNLIKNKP